MKKLIATLIFLSLSLPAFAHSKHEDKHQIQEITVKTIKISAGVFMLQGRGGNIGVSVGTDGLLIIDDDYAEVSPKIAEALKALGSDKPKFIFNTHWHGDHTQGNKIFGQFSTIISHINVRNRLSVDAMRRGTLVPAYPIFALPMLTYEQTMSVHFNGEEIKAVHYPSGHTDGDSFIFFPKSKVVHLGDQFFKGSFPYVDVDSGGTVKGLTENIGAVIAKLPSDVNIIPGHGSLANLEDLKNYHHMLVETTGIIQKGIAENKSLEQLKKEGFPEKYKSWGVGFIKADAWIETIYKSFPKS